VHMQFRNCNETVFHLFSCLRNIKMNFKYPKLARKYLSKNMKKLAKKQVLNQALHAGSKYVDPSGTLSSAIQVAQDGAAAGAQVGQMAGNLMRR